MTVSSSLSSIPIQFAKGVGPRRARLLEKLGVQTVKDAFWFLPWRYENRLEVSPISNLLPGMKATIKGKIQQTKTTTTFRRQMVVVTLLVHDGTGLIECVFFNQPYLEKTLKKGMSLLLTGPVLSHSPGSPRLIMRGPEYEILEDKESEPGAGGKIVPVYHETKGLSSKQIRRIIRSLFDHYANDLQDILPNTLRMSLGIPTVQEALTSLHFPTPDRSVEMLNMRTTPEHGRLAFEELFLLQLALALRRLYQKHDAEGIVFAAHNELLSRLHAALPFQLTAAQRRVIQEIFLDMERPTCMNRLLQGDVGCGKTVVALHAIVKACGSGYQTAFMAPTEVLSEQHYLSLSPVFDALGIRCLLLKGGQNAAERADMLAEIQSGSVQVVIGTHALLQPDVQFPKLGLVIVDEQHKFGVLQRAQLQEKIPWHPDVLVMTATPIPRTLAMTLYGDLDVSIIDEFPPAKKPVKTLLFSSSQRREAYRLVRKELEAGRQAYVVYPLVEPSEKLDLQAAIEAVNHLQEEFSSFRIGLLHGRLSSRDKQAVMTKFKSHEIDLLVATTIVEVGLDVHNATILLVEHAERFGLAQLHQLRGRVGRGQNQGYCVLIHGLGHMVSAPQNAMPFELERRPRSHVLRDLIVTSEGETLSKSTACRRLEVLAQHEDGFALAEEDLKIRGPGHVLGVKQWGEIDFLVADVARDSALLLQAKHLTLAILQQDPTLALPDHQLLKDALYYKWNGKFELGKIG